MVCTICGHELVEGSNFCNICGTPVKGNQKFYEYSDKENKDNEKFTSTLSPDDIMSTVNDGAFNFKEWIDRTTLDSKWKSILNAIYKKTIEIKDKLVPIGKYIIRLLEKVANNFSGAITGAIIGGILGLIISSIPLIGWVLSSMLTPIFVFTGTVIGLATDLKRKLSGPDEAVLEAYLEKILAGRKK